MPYSLADAVSETDCVVLYMPGDGDTLTTGGKMIVYAVEPTGPIFPRLSFAKNWIVLEEVIAIPVTGLGPFVSDVVGVEPSIV